MITITVKSAAFFAYHGFYPEERLLGGRFEVDAAVEFDPDNALNDNIVNTVNYEQLYEIIKAEMSNTKVLIESVAQAIADNIKEKFPFLQTVAVTLRKLNLPLSPGTAHAEVQITLN